MQRLRAILYALKFGLLPWQCYEAECHYAPWSYWRHLWLNLGIVWRWATGQETAQDRQFEQETNQNPPKPDRPCAA